LPASIGILAGMIFYATQDGPLISLYLEDELARGRAEIDDLFKWAGLLALAGAFAAGWAVDRFGATRVIRVSLLLMGCILAPFVFGNLRDGREPVLFVALFLPGEFFTVAMNRHITSHPDPARRGAHIGAYGLLNGLFAPWMLLAGGWMYHAIGHTFPFGVAAAAALIALLLAAMLRRS
jgi:predicted MFS family arabinose efflux permease